MATNSKRAYSRACDIDRYVGQPVSEGPTRGERIPSSPSYSYFRNELKNLAGLMGPQDFASSAHAQAHENMSAEQVQSQAVATVVASTDASFDCTGSCDYQLSDSGDCFGPTLVKTTTVENCKCNRRSSHDDTDDDDNTATTASIAQNHGSRCQPESSLPQVEPQQVVQQTRLDSPVPAV